MSDVLITTELSELGFVGSSAQALARAALEEAKLTRPGKQRISEDKLPRLRDVLATQFALSCSGCWELVRTLRPGTRVVVVRDEHCERCGGSSHRAAALRFISACATANVGRVVVVGGNPTSRQAVTQELSELDVDCIDGTKAMTTQRARRLIGGADLVIVWGGTQLDHSVSSQFAAPQDKWKVVATQKRGLAALLDAGTKHLQHRAPASANRGRLR